MQNDVQAFYDKLYTDHNPRALTRAISVLFGEQAVEAVVKLYKEFDAMEFGGVVMGAYEGFKAGEKKGYQFGGADGWAEGYADGVHDARTAPTRADAVVGGIVYAQDRSEANALIESSAVEADIAEAAAALDDEFEVPPMVMQYTEAHLSLDAIQQANGGR